MPKFTIVSQEITYYETELDADSIEDAEEKFSNAIQNESTLSYLGQSSLEIYKIKEITNA